LHFFRKITTIRIGEETAVRNIVEQVKNNDIKLVTVQFTDLLGIMEEFVGVEELADAGKGG
jgi:hypothetical protein